MQQFPMKSLRLNFPTTTRQATPGAPTCDPSRKLKAWIDPDAAVKADQFGKVTYFFFEQQPDLSWAQVTRSMPVAEALSLNLEGLRVYPAYVVAPTSVQTAFGAPVNPNVLSAAQDATQLAATLNGAGYQCTLSQDMGTVDPLAWGAETRRIYVIQHESQTLNVGGLLFERSQNGVGSPGHWDVSLTEPRWVPELPTTSPTSTLGAWDLPVRQLTADERIGPVGPLGGAPMIQHGPFEESTETPGGLAPADVARLGRMENMLIEICKRFGISG